MQLMVDGTYRAYYNIAISQPVVLRKKLGQCCLHEKCYKHICNYNYSRAGFLSV